jgi:hypothetical protein
LLVNQATCGWFFIGGLIPSPFQWFCKLNSVFVKNVQKMKNRLILSIFLLALLGGCSTPKVIESTRLSDRDLSCESLKEEYRYAEQAKKDAEDVKGVNGTNTAAAIFFPIGIIATYSNANEAIAAADTRMMRLSDLMDKKNCK